MPRRRWGWLPDRAKDLRGVTGRRLRQRADGISIDQDVRQPPRRDRGRLPGGAALGVPVRVPEYCYNARNPR